MSDGCYLFNREYHDLGVVYGVRSLITAFFCRGAAFPATARWATIHGSDGRSPWEALSNHAGSRQPDFTSGDYPSKENIDRCNAPKCNEIQHCNAVDGPSSPSTNRRTDSDVHPAIRYSSPNPIAPRPSRPSPVVALVSYGQIVNEQLPTHSTAPAWHQGQSRFLFRSQHLAVAVLASQTRGSMFLPFSPHVLVGWSGVRALCSPLLPGEGQGVRALLPSRDCRWAPCRAPCRAPCTHGRDRGRQARGEVCCWRESLDRHRRRRTVAVVLLEEFQIPSNNVSPESPVRAPIHAARSILAAGNNLLLHPAGLPPAFIFHAAFICSASKGPGGVPSAA